MNLNYILYYCMQSAIDKIVIYGVPNPQKLKLSQVINNKIKVSTLQFYSNPTSDTPEFMKKIDFEMWAYPDGIKIYNEHFQILNDDEPQFSFFEQSDLLTEVNTTNIRNILQNKQLPQSIYSFVLTDYDLNRTYCACIVWNEKYFIKDDRQDIKDQSQLKSTENSQKIYKVRKQHISMAIPKCTINTMLNNPLILDANVVLVYVPKVMIVCSKIPCIQLHRSLLKHYYENVIKQSKVKQKKMIQIPRFFQQKFNKLIKKYGYPKAQEIFNDDKSQTLRKIQLQLLKNTILMDSQKDNKFSGVMSLQTNKLKQFYISNFFTIPRSYKSTFLLTQNGRKIASKLKSDTVFHLPKIYDLFSQHFQNIDKSFPSLIPLPIPQFIQLWKCLLLQKQIILFSNSQHKSIMLSQFMLYLIQPIKWQNIYIPFLPFHLAHHIDAIGGYLIGMSRIHMDYMLDKFDMKTKVVVDLEFQTILEQGNKQVMELPQEIRLFIQNSLKSILQAYEQTKKPSRSIINYLNLNSQQPSAIKQKIKFKQNFIKYSLQIQKVFFHALVCLFNNFVPFISKKQDGIIAVKTDDYLSIISDKTHRNFMKQISKTMIFIRLCEYHVQQSERCAWVQKTVGELFVYSHDILSHKFIVSDFEGSTKKTLNLSGSKQQIKEKQQNKTAVNSLYIPSQINKQETLTMTPSKIVDRQIKASAWKISDLLKKQEKYCQYIQYLFDKNLKQIIRIVTVIEQYVGAQQKKYNILMGEDQFESFQELQDIKIPLNFGKNDSKQKGSSPLVRKEKQKWQQMVYEQLYNQQSTKSKKWKKFGEKDEQDLYDEMSKICEEYKIQNLLIKYLKYLELNHPDTMVKVNAKKNKKSKKNPGLIHWLWDLLNPPDISRIQQESEIKSKLQKKLTNKYSQLEIFNLKLLFEAVQQKQINVQSQTNIKDKQQKENKFSTEIQKQKNKVQNENNKKNKNENQKLFASKKIVTRTQSDVVKFTQEK